MIEQAPAELIAAGVDAIRFFPIGHESRDIFEPREHIADDGALVQQGARGTRRRRRARHRLSPPAERRRGGELLPEDAARHARLPRGADPRRDAGGLRDPCA
jgi:hypothetical protein